MTAGDTLLLFGNVEHRHICLDAAGWLDPEGTLVSSTDTQTLLYSKTATPPMRISTDHRLLGLHQGRPHPARLLRHGGEPAPGGCTRPGDRQPRDAYNTCRDGADRRVVAGLLRADKSSATTGWTLPGSETSRGAAIGTGTGRVTSVSSDRGSPFARGLVRCPDSTADSSFGEGHHVVDRPEASERSE